MDKLTLQDAKRLNDTLVTEEHLKLHAANVSACMGAMAGHFGEDPEHWEAVGRQVFQMRTSGRSSAMDTRSARMWSR